MAKFGFNIAEVEANTPASYDPIPEGDYQLKALEAEEKTTARGDGTYIKVKFEVITRGPHAGRLLWQNFNVVNPSETAQRIGRQQLAAWAAACGRPDADDTDKLLERPFAASVGIERGTGGYKDSNRIKAFLMPADESAPAPAAPARAPARAAAPAATPAKGANPWD